MRGLFYILCYLDFPPSMGKLIRILLNQLLKDNIITTQSNGIVLAQRLKNSFQDAYNTILKKE